MLLYGTPRHMAAQGRAEVDALSIAELNPLRLGTVVAGSSRTIYPESSGAGRYRITAPVGRSLSIRFFVPQRIPGPADASDLLLDYPAAWWSASTDVRSLKSFDPSQELRVTVPSSGVIYLWLGAKTEVPTDQTSGAYSGVITLSVTVS